MSFADYEDINRICCGWDNEELYDAFLKSKIGKLYSDSSMDSRVTLSGRWWEMAEKEILHEQRESVLL